MEVPMAEKPAESPTVLFFSGTAGKFEQPRVRLFAAAFGVALFVFAVIRMLLMPPA